MLSQKCYSKYLAFKRHEVSTISVAMLMATTIICRRSKIRNSLKLLDTRHFTCLAGNFLDKLHFDLCEKWQQNKSKREVDEKSSKDEGVKGGALAGLSQPYMGVVGSQKKKKKRASDAVRSDLLSQCLQPQRASQWVENSIKIGDLIV